MRLLDSLGVSGSIEFTGLTCKADALPEFPPFRNIAPVVYEDEYQIAAE